MNSNRNRNQPADIGRVFATGGRGVFAWTFLLLACAIGSINYCVKLVSESTWTSWKAEVVKADIISVEGDYADLQLEYRYQVNGKPFTVVEQIYRGKAQAARAKKAELEKKHFVKIFVNPSNPTEARLDDSSTVKLLFVFMACSLLSGLGFAWGIKILFFPKNADPIRRTDDSGEI